MTRGKKFLLVYLLLLAASHLCKPFRSDHTPLASDQQSATIDDLQFAYRDLPASAPDAPPLVILHSSPYRPPDLTDLQKQFRLIIPDLPGFGASTTKIEDYSIDAQAAHVLALLDHLEIPDAHFAGVGLGGATSLSLYSMEPERVRSLSLIASDGVQELELLGDYTLNHAVHAAQLFYLWLFYNGTPNFGIFDHARHNLSYARSYYDTDQRPIRNILQTVDVPTLIIHGENDLIVPLAAAKEHARLVPHSQTKFIEGAGHNLLKKHSGEIASSVATFIGTNSDTRSDATPSRAKASTAPFDYHSYQNDLKRRVVLLVILLAIATLVSEDITCITAGLLVSQGALGFFPATLGCFLGIFIGDTGLYLIGRILGVRALRYPPLRWFVNAQKIERSKKFFDRYGPVLIVVTRWLPGMRIPTYVAAGMLRLPFLKFLSYFLCAAIIWTPALVGISTVIGERLLGWLHRFEQHALLVLVLTIATVLFLVHLALALATHRGRQLLRAKWHNRLHWRRWPSWLKFLPLAPYIVFLTLKHRRLASPPQPLLHTPTVTGDGERTLEFLILDDPDTRPDAEHFLAHHSAELEDIPAAGKSVPLSPVEKNTPANYLNTLQNKASAWRRQFEEKNLR